MTTYNFEKGLGGNAGYSLRQETWRAWGDSNARPTAPEAVTLSTELQARMGFEH